MQVLVNKKKHIKTYNSDSKQKKNEKKKRFGWRIPFSLVASLIIWRTNTADTANVNVEQAGEGGWYFQD